TNSANGTSPDYKFFFNWNISVPCESPRMPVIAAIHPAADFEVATDAVVCNNVPVAIEVITPSANFDSVTWAPIAGLYTDPAGTVPYTSGHAAIVYARNTTPGIRTYIASAYNTLTGCGNIDTVEMFVQPAQATATANPPE